MIERIRTPAKINLFLYVTSKRKDGYHELLTLMTCIDLWDEIELDFTGNGLEVRCSYPGVPENDSNLVIKAARLFFSWLDRVKKKKRRSSGLKILIDKKIPVGGGLGGGSSNAAGILKALNDYHGDPFSKSELMEMGLSLGADVPFFIFGSSAIAQGIGECLEPAPLLKPYSILVLNPGIHSSTAQVYKNLDLALTKDRKSNNNALLNLCRTVRVLDIIPYLHNDLETAAVRLYPDIGCVKDAMAGFYPEGLMMSGSGSSFFALFSEASKAEDAYEKLCAQWNSEGRHLILTSFVTAEDAAFSGSV